VDDMQVLVGYTSRHGATAEIAARVGDVLREVLTTAETTSTVDVYNLADVDDVTGYDAVLVGSAIYLGRWSGVARMFVHDNLADLTRRPVWFFSSGPIGGMAAPVDEPSEARALADLVGVRGHRVFPGRLRPADLGFTERITVRAVHAQEGDYRDWYDVAQWAVDVGDELLGSPVSAP
jgi:menaquinone-dependent protoporphyrinogen oxidase